MVLLNGQIIALGAGIKGDTEASIETVVDNRLLNDAYQYQVLSNIGEIHEKMKRVKTMVITKVGSFQC